MAFLAKNMKNTIKVIDFQKNEIERPYCSRYGNKHFFFFVGCCLFIYGGFNKNLN